MSTNSRLIKSFSLDKQIIKEVERTKGPNSASERVNQLLLLALNAERNQTLFAEAEAFFHKKKDDRRERKAFRRASIRSIARNED